MFLPEARNCMQEKNLGARESTAQTDRHCRRRLNVSYAVIEKVVGVS